MACGRMSEGDGDLKQIHTYSVVHFKNCIISDLWFIVLSLDSHVNVFYTIPLFGICQKCVGTVAGGAQNVLRNRAWNDWAKLIK